MFSNDRNVKNYSFIQANVVSFIYNFKNKKIRMLKRTFILFLLISNLAFSQNDIQQKVNAVAAYQGFANASLSFQAIDCATGYEIASYNALTSLAPASTMKLFSTGSAIDILGPNYRPYTTLYYDGTISKDSILTGNIWIVGGGDMGLGSRYLTDDKNQTEFLNEWTNSVKKNGD